MGGPAAGTGNCPSERKKKMVIKVVFFQQTDGLIESFFFFFKSKKNKIKKNGYILMVLTVGHVWIKQVLGPIVLVGLSILAPVGFSKSWVRMKHGDSGHAEEDSSDTEFYL